GAGENFPALWSAQTAFQIADAEKYVLPHAQGLQALEHTALPLVVNDASFGSFGPRQVNDENQLFDDYSLVDSRGSSTFVLGFNPDWQAPMIFQSNLKPMPGNWSHRLVSS